MEDVQVATNTSSDFQQLVQYYCACSQCGTCLLLHRRRLFYPIVLPGRLARHTTPVRSLVSRNGWSYGFHTHLIRRLREEHWPLSGCHSLRILFLDLVYCLFIDFPPYKAGHKSSPSRFSWV
jgi:hypothetical protein